MPLTLEQATSIKSQLWAGSSIHTIAAAFRPRLSPSTIGHIRSGVRWKAAPWPDKTTGAMPAKRAKEIAKARKSALANVRV